MQKRIGDMDCIIEVHDARIPFTGRNPIFDRHAKMRPHILVLSKVRSIAPSLATFEKLAASAFTWLCFQHFYKLE